MSNITIGVILGNRDFFPDHLVGQARKDISQLCKKLGVKMVCLSPKDTKLGGVETYSDAKKCAELFRANRDKIAGVLVSLPNFGDEKGVVEVLKLAELNVPVLVQAYPDDLGKLNVENRRDGFCGKISVCNNLIQSDIPFSLTHRHVVAPSDKSFCADFERFLGVCRVVRGLKNARLGAIGARPAAFNTVRYSEKLLEAAGITVTTVDWSELLGVAGKLGEKDRAVVRKLQTIKSYMPTGAVPADKLVKMAALGVAVDNWVAANEIQATALQCWTSIQANYGINVCTLMSMMSANMAPSACEVDVTGALSMYVLQLAAGRPAALVDWNNNYGDSDDKAVLFHCGNWASCFLPGGKLSNAPILGSTLGVANTFGTVVGRTPAGG